MGNGGYNSIYKLVGAHLVHATCMFMFQSREMVLLFLSNFKMFKNSGFLASE